MSKQMTPLRQRMIEDMAIRNMFAEHPEDLRSCCSKLQHLPRAFAVAYPVDSGSSIYSGYAGLMG